MRWRGTGSRRQGDASGRLGPAERAGRTHLAGDGPDVLHGARLVLPAVLGDRGGQLDALAGGVVLRGRHCGDDEKHTGRRARARDRERGRGRRTAAVHAGGGRPLADPGASSASRMHFSLTRVLHPVEQLADGDKPDVVLGGRVLDKPDGRVGVVLRGAVQMNWGTVIGRAAQLNMAQPSPVQPQASPTLQQPSSSPAQQQRRSQR